VIAPDLEAAALDHVDLDLVAVEIEMIVTTVVIVVIVEVERVADRGREVVIVAGGDRGVDLVRMIGGGVEVQGPDPIVVVAAMIVAAEEGTEIDVIGVIFVTEIDMGPHITVAAAAVDHGAIMMTDMDPLHQDSLADHLAQSGSHITSQAIFHHPMQEIEGADVPLGVMMVHQV